MISLADHVKRLREAEKNKPIQADDAILFWGDYDDKNYLPYLKSCVGSVTTYVRIEKITTVTQLQMACKAKGVNRVISSSLQLLSLLLKWDKRKAPSLSDYAGSYFRIPSMDKNNNIEIVFISPLKQLFTVPYGKFMTTRIITKLTNPSKWYVPTPFRGFTLLDAENEKSYFSQFQAAFLISIDIETFKENAAIRCVSYTGFFQSGDTTPFYSISVVLPMDSEYSLAIMRNWNWNLKAPKVFQNGKYDISYFTRYSAPVYNYLYDTAHLFHSWYSELPKDLGFLNTFFIREAVYWKDLAETNDLHEYYRYNALDTWGTGNCFLAMLLEAPSYASSNYLLEFPLVFPCHLCEMTGIARDKDRMGEAATSLKQAIDTEGKILNTILDIPAGHSFNSNSPKQMKDLLKILGCSDLPSADEKNLNKAAFRHPLNSRIIGQIIKIRKARKLLSTYLTAGKEFSRLDNTGNRILYSLNPQGTDSSRLASREHSFWCGLNIQNIPRGPAVKRTLVADPGFLFAEVDLEQAESRDTAYISGEEKLIYNVEESPDFHSANASSFFGVPFDKIFDKELGKVLDKALRDVAKRVNHGANYNMGPYVLVDTMGEAAILRAKNLLGLPRMWTFIEVAEYLLAQFHKTYPGLRAVYYAGLVDEIMKTRLLKSKAMHWSWTCVPRIKDLNATAISLYTEAEDKGELNAWTRYCFSDPTKSKPALNSYISHPPQSLNAQTLNKGFIAVFKDIAMNPQYSINFKLCAQIHDSILFQYRIGHEYLCDMVRERMEIPVTIRAYDGKIRTFVVPASVKRGTAENNYMAKYWSETE